MSIRVKIATLGKINLPGIQSPPFSNLGKKKQNPKIYKQCKDIETLLQNTLTVCSSDFLKQSWGAWSLGAVNTFAPHELRAHPLNMCLSLSALSSEEVQCGPTSPEAPSPVSCSDPPVVPEGARKRPTDPHFSHHCINAPCHS